MKILYTILTSPLGLGINPIWEYIIMLFVGEIVHEIAWNVSPGGRLGSFVYWTTKIIVFIVIWALLAGIIALCKFIYANWVWFVMALGVFGTIGVLIWINIHCKRNKKPDSNDKE